jgi:threonine dehydrogenase-like Zn-dependent dehydrogenase
LAIAVESDVVRAAMAKRMGADVVIDQTKTDAVQEILRLTHGKGVDVSIEALGTQATFESALRALRAGGTLSSLGVYSGKLSVPVEPFAAGLGDHKIVTTLCPGGKERMRRLMELVRHGRLDLRPLLTHAFSLDRITEAYELFGNRRDGVIKVAIRP